MSLSHGSPELPLTSLTLGVLFPIRQRAIAVQSCVVSFVGNFEAKTVQCLHPIEELTARQESEHGTETKTGRSLPIKQGPSRRKGDSISSLKGREDEWAGCLPT
jgi:hypothetical protein